MEEKKIKYYGKRRSIVRRIGSMLPLKPPPKIYVSVTPLHSMSSSMIDQEPISDYKYTNGFGAGSVPRHRRQRTWLSHAGMEARIYAPQTTAAASQSRQQQQQYESKSSSATISFGKSLIGTRVRMLAAVDAVCSSGRAIKLADPIALFTRKYRRQRSCKPLNAFEKRRVFSRAFLFFFFFYASIRQKSNGNRGSGNNRSNNNDGRGGGDGAEWHAGNEEQQEEEEDNNDDDSSSTMTASPPKLPLDIIVPPAVLQRRGGMCLTGVIIRAFLQLSLHNLHQLPVQHKLTVCFKFNKYSTRIIIIIIIDKKHARPKEDDPRFSAHQARTVEKTGKKKLKTTVSSAQELATRELIKLEGPAARLREAAGTTGGSSTTYSSSRASPSRDSSLSQGGGDGGGADLPDDSSSSPAKGSSAVAAAAAAAAAASTTTAANSSSSSSSSTSESSSGSSSSDSSDSSSSSKRETTTSSSSTTTTSSTSSSSSSSGSSRRRSSSVGSMQCGLCAYIAGLFRRAMCIAGSRRGSAESTTSYHELPTQAQLNRIERGREREIKLISEAKMPRAVYYIHRRWRSLRASSQRKNAYIYTDKAAAAAAAASAPLLCARPPSHGYYLLLSARSACELARWIARISRALSRRVHRVAINSSATGRPIPVYNDEIFVVPALWNNIFSLVENKNLPHLRSIDSSLSSSSRTCTAVAAAQPSIDFIYKIYLRAAADDDDYTARVCAHWKAFQRELTYIDIVAQLARVRMRELPRRRVREREDEIDTSNILLYTSYLKQRGSFPASTTTAATTAYYMELPRLQSEQSLPPLRRAPTLCARLKLMIPGRLYTLTRDDCGDFFFFAPPRSRAI
ncbi:unnamed protein product [Trichogramma brassicae]|uniref:PH domain-containing protein n=1 Tax=Trichogramma brassicae TaxID=86971 RepID=A0A6H5IE51_9HYME|nr:unnamed protein product [Trichogramma brassicae]